MQLFYSGFLQETNYIHCNKNEPNHEELAIKSLQLIQNAPAIVLMNITKRYHIFSVLRSLQWLPIKSRIKFRMLLLTYKALNDHGLSYICESDTLSTFKAMLKIFLIDKAFKISLVVASHWIFKSGLLCTHSTGVCIFWTQVALLVGVQDCMKGAKLSTDGALDWVSLNGGVGEG